MRKLKIYLDTIKTQKKWRNYYYKNIDIVQPSALVAEEGEND